MKYLLFILVCFLASCSILNLTIFAQNVPVSMVNRGNYYELIIDYTSGISHYEMGKQIVLKILEFFPNMEEMADKNLDDAAISFPYNLSLARMYDVKPQVQQEYIDEIEGIASILCTADVTARNDGKLSKDELYMCFLSDDIFATSQCSSISVFGSRSENGSSITARLNDGYDSPDNYFALTQSVTTIKYKDRSICIIGNLSIGAATGFNSNGIFIALHSSNTGTEYSSKNKKSYLMDVRYALEHFSTSDEMAEYFTANSKSYIQNRLIQLTDKNNTRILENNFSGTATDMRCALRTDTSELNPGVIWGLTNAITTANSFVLKGNSDNHTTTKECYARWNTIKNRLQLCGDKVSIDELKQIASFDNGDGPGLQADGDIYNVGTKQITIFQPDNFHLEVAFKPKNGFLPDDPKFEEIPVYFDTILTALSRNNKIISRYVLQQNYPNPFNPITTIQYSIPTESFVSLKIYDILGNEIATLVNERITVGNYSVNFNASNLPSGIYFYRMQAGSFASTKKFVLLK